MSDLGLVEPASQKLFGTQRWAWPHGAKEKVSRSRRARVECGQLFREIEEGQLYKAWGQDKATIGTEFLNWELTWGLTHRDKGRHLLLKLVARVHENKKWNLKMIQKCDLTPSCETLAIVFLLIRESRMFSEPRVWWGPWPHLYELDGGRIRGWVTSQVILFPASPDALIMAYLPLPTLQQKEKKKKKRH